jgi:hypothetical protein
MNDLTTLFKNQRAIEKNLATTMEHVVALENKVKTLEKLVSKLVAKVVPAMTQEELDEWFGPNMDSSWCIPTKSTTSIKTKYIKDYE